MLGSLTKGILRPAKSIIRPEPRTKQRSLLGSRVNKGSAPHAPSDGPPGSPLLWYDPTDLATLFQDVTGETPVTSNLDVVRRWESKGSVVSPLVTGASDTDVFWLEGPPSGIAFSGSGADMVVTNPTATTGAGLTIAFVVIVTDVSDDGTLFNFNNANTVGIGLSSDDAGVYANSGTIAAMSSSGVADVTPFGAIMTHASATSNYALYVSSKAGSLTGTNTFRQLGTNESATLMGSDIETPTVCSHLLVYDSLPAVDSVKDWLTDNSPITGWT